MPAAKFGHATLFAKEQEVGDKWLILDNVGKAIHALFLFDAVITAPRNLVEHFEQAAIKEGVAFHGDARVPDREIKETVKNAAEKGDLWRPGQPLAASRLGNPRLFIGGSKNKQGTLRVISALELMKTTFPKSEDIISGILPVNGKCIISAPAKLGKTRFLSGLAFGIATGQNVMGFKIMRARRVLYFQAEVSEPSLQDRLEKMLAVFSYDENLLRENLLFCNDPRLKLTLAEFVKSWRMRLGFIGIFCPSCVGDCIVQNKHGKDSLWSIAGDSMCKPKDWCLHRIPERTGIFVKALDGFDGVLHGIYFRSMDCLVFHNFFIKLVMYSSKPSSSLSLNDPCILVSDWPSI